MKWIGERISFVDDKKKTSIVIHPENGGLLKSLMGAWVSMWLVLGAIVIWALSTMKLNDQEVIILVIFLSFWAYYAMRVTKSWAWLMWGKELVKIDETALTYKKSIKKYGRATPYYLENIKGIKVDIPEEKSFQSAWEKSIWTRGGERFDFEYMGKTVRFGFKLNKKDSDILFRLITKRIEAQLKKSK